MTTAASPSSDIDAFCTVLANAKDVAILTGVGLSAASGIQTYRGVDGQWNDTDPATVVSTQAWKEDPGRVWKYFHNQRVKCLEASPNPAHTALASLSIPSTRARLLPSLLDPSKPPLYVTQNFDGLCRRALDDALLRAGELDDEERQTAHDRLIEMHGSAYKTICMQCKAVKWTKETTLAAVFQGASSNSNIKIELDQLPRCGGPAWSGSNRYGQCGGLLRPGVTWFGEVPEGQGEIVRLLTKVDVLFVVGTSSLVYPAASYAGTVKKNGGTVAIFNASPSKGDDHADFAFYAGCEDTIPALFKRLGELYAH